MMKKFFSNATRTFFLEDYKTAYEAAGTWPVDAVEVSEQDWKTFTGAAPAYQLPAVDGAGSMYWMDDPGVDVAAMTLQRNTDIRNSLLRQVALGSFPLQAAVSMGVATEEQQAQLTANQQYVLELMQVDLTQNPASWPEEPEILFNGA